MRSKGVVVAPMNPQARRSIWIGAVITVSMVFVIVPASLARAGTGPALPRIMLAVGPNEFLSKPKQMSCVDYCTYGTNDMEGDLRVITWNTWTSQMAAGEGTYVFTYFRD